MLDPNISNLSGDEEISQPTELPIDPIPIIEPPIELPPVFGQDGVIGDPTDSQYGDVRHATDSAAIIGAGSVIHAMTGVDYSEGVLTVKAAALGLYDGGTILENFGKLLDAYEIPYHVNESGTMRDIVEELAYGHKVFVAISGPELWGRELGGWVSEVLDWIQENIWTGGNHAVWITSVDVNDPSNITVTLNDSGQLDGIGKVYTLEDFVDAAEDARFHYVATNEAAPGTFSGSEPDPDLAAFPEIKDYYEIRSKFDIEKMRFVANENMSLFIEPFMEWLNDRGLVAHPEVMLREYVSKHGMSVKQWLQDKGLVVEYDSEKGLSREQFRILAENYSREFRQIVESYIVDHITADIADSLGINVKDTLGFDALYDRWVSKNFSEADDVRDVCARLKELGFEAQTHTGATYEDVVSDVKSTGSTAIVAVDIDELKVGAKPLHFFWEKFMQVMLPGAKLRLGIVFFIPAVVHGVVETVGAAFDIGGDSPDSLVRVEFGDDSVNVRWPDGEEESLSHDVFERAFEDSRFSYILLKT